MTGYSGTPLVRKLGIRAVCVVALAGAPPGYRARLAPLPAGVRIVGRAGRRTDLVHLFVTRRTDPTRALARYRRILPAHAAVWVFWPKRSARAATDLTEDVIREVALGLGYVDVKVCAVDAVWSGLKLVVRREAR